MTIFIRDDYPLQAADNFRPQCASFSKSIKIESSEVLVKADLVVATGISEKGTQSRPEALFVFACVALYSEACFKFRACCA
ncbi:hypothetical protein DND62_28230 [Pseudomonas syringae pv. pisi]|nr:hypothetical protein DND62_28230 [Pseudomonas syringae pv. pisi]